jgi:dolichol-phosphate mannosyltransferase
MPAAPVLDPSHPAFPGWPTIVVPTYNERENLPRLVEGVFAALPNARVLVVDDDSPDGTAALCRELMARYPNLDVLVRKGERGLGGALIAGYEAALARGAPVVGSMDCDLSHNPADLPAMLAHLVDHDVCAGSRYMPGGGTVGWGPHRKLLSWSANRFAALLLGLTIRDLTTNFRLVRAAQLRKVALDEIMSSGYSFQVEILYRLVHSGARIAEHPIIFVDRRAGQSKMSTAEISGGVRNLLRLRQSMGRIERRRTA